MQVKALAGTGKPVHRLRCCLAGLAEPTSLDVRVQLTQQVGGCKLGVAPGLVEPPDHLCFAHGRETEWVKRAASFRVNLPQIPQQRGAWVARWRQLEVRFRLADMFPVLLRFVAQEGLHATQAAPRMNVKAVDQLVAGCHARVP